VAIDAFDSLSEPFEFEASGDLRADLVTVLGRLAADLPEARWASVLTALVAAAEHDPELAERKRALADSRRRATMSLIEDAADRGEIRADVDPELVAAMLAGPLFYRRLLTNEPLDRHLVSTIVATVLSGLGYGEVGPEAG
jgi:Tetracyclin repressor-like, C-terminal domain